MAGELVERLRASIVVTSEGKGLRMSLSADDVEAAADELTALTAKVALLTEALKPFAESAGAYDPDEGDDRDVAWAHDFPIGALRRARRALSEEGT